MIDGIGIHGTVFHYTAVFTLCFGAMIVMAYCWARGYLTFDEDPKHEMMNDEVVDGD